MAIQQSEWVKAFGRAFEFFRAIANAVLEVGGGDEDMKKVLKDKGLRQQIAGLIVGKPTEAPAAPPNWWKQLLQFAIEAGRFTYVNPGITAERFPYVPGDLDDDGEEIEVPIDRGMSTTDVRALIERDSRGLEPASGFRLLRWWFKHPERHNNCLVVALGQEFDGSVLDVDGGGDYRRLGLGHVARGWVQDYTFLVVRKSSN